MNQADETVQDDTYETELSEADLDQVAGGAIDAGGPPAAPPLATPAPFPDGGDQPVAPIAVSDNYSATPPVVLRACLSRNCVGAGRRKNRPPGAEREDRP